MFRILKILGRVHDTFAISGEARETCNRWTVPATFFRSSLYAGSHHVLVCVGIFLTGYDFHIQ